MMQLLHVLSGDPIVVFDDFEEIIYCEAKNFPRRGVGIPETESVLKGPREGFNELIVDNVALIRRRIKNPDLKFETLIVGEKTQTAVAITYIKGIAPEEIIKQVKETIKNLDIRFILDTNYIEASLKKQESFFDTVGYTEKPDEVSAKLLEGRVGVIVDGTPFVITVPYFFLENFQMPDDYYLNKHYTNLNRILRWMAFFIAAFVPGIYVATITYHFSMIPSLFIFRLAVSRAGVPFPTVLEVIIMMLAFQLIKEAGLRMPKPIGGAMSIVAALILGDAAVGAGYCIKNNNNNCCNKHFKLFPNSKTLWSSIILGNGTSNICSTFWVARSYCRANDFINTNSTIRLSRISLSFPNWKHRRI